MKEGTNDIKKIICSKCKEESICKKMDDGTWLCTTCAMMVDIANMGQIGIGQTSPKGILFCKCEICRNEITWPWNNEWQIQIHGLIQFRCRRCGSVSNLLKFPGFWHDPIIREEPT